MKRCTMNCGQAMWDKRSREQMMAECDDCVTEPCNPAEDGVCEALECPRADDTALLRQALEALDVYREYDPEGCGVADKVVAALSARLGETK